MQTKDVGNEGDVVEVIHEHIHVEDSFSEPPQIKKKSRNPGTGAKKIQGSPKVALTPRRERKRRFPKGRLPALQGNWLLMRVPILAQTPKSSR